MRAAAAVVLMLVLVLPAAAAQPKRATLKLMGLTPLVVQGRAFDKAERVVLTASAPSVRRMLGVDAKRNGSFTARFDVRLGRCTPPPCALSARSAAGLSSSSSPVATSGGGGPGTAGPLPTDPDQPPGCRTPFTLSEYGA